MMASDWISNQNQAEGMGLASIEKGGQLGVILEIVAIPGNGTRILFHREE